MNNEAGFEPGQTVQIIQYPAQTSGRFDEVLSEPTQITRVVRQGVWVQLGSTEVFLFNEAVKRV